ncbi:MAG: metal dependent phosphohydrolase, partial [uncultured bacterium]
MTIVNPGQRIEKIVLNLSNLPSLPFIANKIIEVAESKTSAAKDIAEIIAIDQSLTAKLLKLVNSSFYGFSSKIATVSRAVVVLGFQTVKTLALGVTVFKTASKMQGDKVCLDMEKFWEHSVGVAAGAKLLAELTGYVMTEEAFLAGLLHDIGKIIFNQYLPDEFSKALYLAKTNNIPLLLAEREIIKADHEVAGDYLAERWKIPYNLRIAVSRHHNPPFREEHIAPDVLKLTCIVSLSNTLCKMRKIGYSGNDQVTAKEEAVMHWLNIGEKEINRFFMQIDSELEKAKEFLGILNES